MDSERKPTCPIYSASESKITRLPFGRNGKTILRLNSSAEPFMFINDHSPPSDAMDNVVSPTKIEIQAPTTTATRDAELPSPYDQEETHGNSRAQNIADGIKRLVLVHESLELEKEKTRLVHHAHERSEKNEDALKGNRGSANTPQEDSQGVPPKPKPAHIRIDSPKPIKDRLRDSNKTPISPRSVWTGGKVCPYSLAQAGSKNGNVIGNGMLLSKERIGQILPSDEISSISDLTMEGSEYLMKSMTVSCANPPPPPPPPHPPKRQNLRQNASKVHPPPPPRWRTSSSSSFSRRSEANVAPHSPLPMRSIPKASSPYPHPLTTFDKPSRAHSPEMRPDTSSHVQDYDATSSPLPRKKSLQRIPPPPPPRSKTTGKSSLDLSLFDPCPGNVKLFNSDSDRNHYTHTSTRIFSSSEKDFSGSSSLGKPSHKPRQTLMSGEANYATLRDTVTSNANSSSFAEYRRLHNISPPSRCSLNLVGEREKNLLPRKAKSFCRNPDLDRVRDTRQSSSSDSKTDGCMSSLPLHDKPSERGKCIPTLKDRGANKYEKHTTTKSRAPSNKPKFDKNGRCLQHPSVIVAQKKPFGIGWRVLQDGCQKCMQGCSNTSFAGSKITFSKSARSLAGVSKPITSRRNSREHRTSSSQTQLLKSQIPTNKSVSARAIVSKMPYTTQWGKSGWYSGEVNDSGIPNGAGMMRFKHGDKHDGQWINGFSEQFLKNSHRMKRVFSKNRSPWSEPASFAGSRHVKIYPEIYPSGNMQSSYHHQHVCPQSMQYQPDYGGALYQQQCWY